MADKTIVCIGCSKPFVWTEREQEFFRKVNLQHEPKRCPACRLKKREQRKLDRTEEPGGDMMAEG